MWWAPTKHSPQVRLAPAGTPPAMRQAVIDMHQAEVEYGVWIAEHWPPCVVDYVPSKGATPWQVRFFNRENGSRYPATYHWTKLAALNSRPDIIKFSEH